jgi:hypothetical protein
LVVLRMGTHGRTAAHSPPPSVRLVSRPHPSRSASRRLAAATRRRLSPAFRVRVDVAFDAAVDFVMTVKAYVIDADAADALHE